jgi:hypothetical protein
MARLQLLDTQLFDRAGKAYLDRGEDWRSAFSRWRAQGPLVSTVRNEAELRANPNPDVREASLVIYNDVLDGQVGTATLNAVMATDGGAEIFAMVSEIWTDLNARSPRRSTANHIDALLGQLAVHDPAGIVLRTRDRLLQNAVRARGGAAPWP